VILVLALAAGVAAGTGLRLLLRRDLLRACLGLVLMGSGVNLALFAAGGGISSVPPVIKAGEERLRTAADPVPQALALTAIVIGFALMAFALVLVLRQIELQRSDDALDLGPAATGVHPPPAASEGSGA
jgi:multicomponent Na+:H+ antiporter subunit C